jgi:hypothetical protein
MTTLERVGDDLWLAEGPAVSFFGFPYPTRMAVARLRDATTWIGSPIELDAELREEVEALGEPRHLVEPNKLHHLALSQWVDAWPDANVYAPPGLAKKRPDISFVAELTDESPAAWADEIDQVRVEGSFAMTEVLFFHRPSRTCLVGDLIQKHDPDAMKAWQRWVMKADGLAGPDGSTPREWRLTFLDRARAREAIRTAIAWNAANVVIADGTNAFGNGLKPSDIRCGGCTTTDACHQNQPGVTFSRTPSVMSRILGPSSHSLRHTNTPVSSSMVPAWVVKSSGFASLAASRAIVRPVVSTNRPQARSESASSTKTLPIGRSTTRLGFAPRTM